MISLVSVSCAESIQSEKFLQVLAFFAHAYLVVFHSFDEDNLDGKVRAAVPWFIISIFVVEGEIDSKIDFLSIFLDRDHPHTEGGSRSDTRFCHKF